MKRFILPALLAIMVLGSFAAGDEPNTILGRWQNNIIYQGEPFSFLIIFRANGKYDGFANKKAFVSGTYQMQHDTLYISDPICNSNYRGTYKVKLFAQDSLQFHLIGDTCQGRREGISNFTFKKAKAVTK